MSVTYAPRPEITPPGPWAFPTPEILTLANGIEVHAYHLPGKQLLAANLVLEGSAYDDPVGLEGLASLALSAITEGSGNMSGLEFAQAVSALGGAIDAGASLATSSAHVSAPANRFEEAMRLLMQALTSPRFSDEDIERVIARRIEGIRYRKADPSAVARETLDDIYYPPGSRTTVHVEGTMTTLSSITPEHVRNFYRDHVGPFGATLVLAGDLATIDLRPLLDATLGTWHDETTVSADEPALQAEPSRFVLVDRAGSVQSELLVAWPAVTRHDSNWVALQLGSHILGGGMESLLFKRMREEKGYTYGAHCRPEATAVNSRLIAGSAVETNSTAEGVADLLDVIGTAARFGFAADAHADAVSEVAGAVPFSVESSLTMANRAARDVSLGLPVDYATKNLEAIVTSTHQSINTGFASAMSIEHPVIVVVGDADLVADSLRELGIGDLEILRDDPSHGRSDEFVR